MQWKRIYANVKRILCLEFDFGKILPDTTCYISKMYNILHILLILLYVNSWSISFATVNFYSDKR